MHSGYAFGLRISSFWLGVLLFTLQGRGMICNFFGVTQGEKVGSLLRGLVTRGPNLARPYFQNIPRVCFSPLLSQTQDSSLRVSYITLVFINRIACCSIRELVIDNNLRTKFQSHLPDLPQHRVQVLFLTFSSKKPQLPRAEIGTFSLFIS